MYATKSALGANIAIVINCFVAHGSKLPAAAEYKAKTPINDIISTFTYSVISMPFMKKAPPILGELYLLINNSIISIYIYHSFAIK